MTDRTCDATGCDRKTHARGKCASHYAQWYKAKHYKTWTRECAHCAELFDTYNEQTACCSDTCAQRHRFGWDVWSGCQDLVPVPKRPLVRTIPPKRSRWFACKCDICGVGFIAEGLHATCSDECGDAYRRRQKRIGRIRYKIARGRFAVTDDFRLAIYERDRWTCQLCGKPTSRTYQHADPYSPTLDHIIPQSHTPVPDHGAHNLRLAHALCNSLRQDRIEVDPDGMADLGSPAPTPC